MTCIGQISGVVLCVLVGSATVRGGDGASPPAPLMEKPARTLWTEHLQADLVIVKFAHESAVRLRSGHLSRPIHDESLGRIEDVLRLYGARIRRLLDQDEETLDGLRKRGEQRTGQTLHDLNLFHRVDLAGPDGPELCDVLNSFEVVEIAYLAGNVTDPVAVAPGPGTPDFQPGQGYRTAAPTGVDADHGDTFPGARGTGITIADVETGWTDDHEDIRHKTLGAFIGLTPAPYPWDHGTAVLGELVGEDNASGVKGIVSDASVLLSSHLGSTPNIPTAIVHAVQAVAMGDVVVLEVQCFQGPPSPHPCEYDPAIFATVQTATANGIHVFAAAGNGNQNLDSAAYGGAFDRAVRDSGAVLVGASDGVNLFPASFSNHGSRLDAHGWGWDVTTCAYGDLQAGPAQQEYTATFSGTSSATPIVTGAGVMIAGIHRHVFGTSLDPMTLRSLLGATGTPQTGGANIGPRPNVRSALRSLRVPEVEIVGHQAGASATLTSFGTPGDLFGLMVAAARLPVPQSLPPFGDLFLSGPLRFVFLGVIGPTGQTPLTGIIPVELAGETIFFEELHLFLSGAKVGAFSNYFELAIQ